MSRRQSKTGDSQGALRLAIIIDALTAGGGTENQLLLLLTHLDQSRVVPLLFTIRGNTVCDLLGARIAAFDLSLGPLFSVRGVRGVARVASMLRAQRVDLVLTFFIDGNLLGTLAGRLAGIRIVSSRRNLGRGYWHSRGHLWRLKVLNSMTYRWLANSEAVRQYTAAAEGVDPDRITVIRNAVDTGRFRPATEIERLQARARLGIPEADRAIACVANLRPVKDHGTLLRAFAITLRADPKLQLLLAGHGEEEPALRALAGELGIAERVRFLGGLDSTVSVLHACDAAVLSSVAESLPNAVIEALACGLPVAATEVGGVPELLAGRTFGRLTTPSNPDSLAAALCDVLAGPARDPAARASARSFAVEEFSLPVILNQWYAFLETCRARTGHASGLERRTHAKD